MLRIVSVLAVVLLALTVACGDDEEAEGPAATDTAAATATPLPGERGGAIEPPLTQELIDAIAEYVGTTGLDGDTFQLTDPVTCDEITLLVEGAASEAEEMEIIAGTVGKICLAPDKFPVLEDSAEVAVGIYATEASWKLTLERQDGEWQVTDVEYTGL